MRRTAMMVVAAVLIAAAQASAEFEGIIDMKMTSEHGTGTVKINVSRAGMLNDIDMRMVDQPVKISTLIKFDNPDKIYHLDHSAKTYAVTDLKKIKETAQKADDPKNYTVKNLGREKVRGYDCAHSLVVHERGGETELWTTRDLLDYEEFAKAMESRSRGSMDFGYMGALKDAGAEGFPVKSIHRGEKDGGMTLELVKAERKSFPASVFEIPKGYAESKGFMGVNTAVGTPAGKSMPPDAMKAMEEQMENLPPEQREMIEKMMRQNSGR